MKTFLRLSLMVVASLTFAACGVDDATVGGDDGAMLDESELTSNSRFETFTGRDGQFYFHLLAGNGQKVLASEGYTTVAAAEAGIASVKAHGVSEQRYLMRQASDGASYFVVTAVNGEIIAISEMYATSSNASRAVTAVIRIVSATVKQGPAATISTRFDVFRGIDSKYYFHLKASNGQIVLQSQGYSTRTAALNGVSSVQANGGNPARFTVLPAADGKFYFVLRATNGQIIGRGETYESKSNAERGVQTVISLLASVR